MHVVHCHYVIRTDRSVRVRWSATAAEVACSVKADDRRGYQNLAEHSLYCRVANDPTDGSQRNRALLFVFAQLELLWEQRLDGTQWRRDIELHHRHHA